MSFLKSAFENKLAVDDREVSRIISVPGIDGEFGVMAPKLEFWIQLTTMVLLNTLTMLIWAAIIYKFIIEKRGTTTSLLVGYGFVIPLSLVFPFKTLDFLELENIILKMSAGTAPTVIFFRCIAAMHGTSPPVVESSMSAFLLYCMSIVPFEWDTKTQLRVKITMNQMLVNTRRLAVQYVLLSMLVSYLMAYDYQPFDSNVVLEDFHLNLDLFKPGQLMNNYLLAWVTFFTLSFGFNLVAMMHNAQGYKTPDIFRNPMLASTSPSDFWNRRWNSIVQHSLKYGIFRPAKLIMPTSAALLVTFMFSGLLHDYSWTVMFYHRPAVYVNGKCENCFVPIMFKQTAFFVWNGAFMLLEVPMSKTAVCQWISRTLPRFVISIMVTFLAVPVAHWFAGDWAVGRAFTDYSIGLIRVVKM